MTDLHETKEWKDMIAGVDRQIAAEGGSTGSNMTEPLYFAPGPVKIPDGLPPEEVARRKKLLAEVKEYISHL